MRDITKEILEELYYKEKKSTRKIFKEINLGIGILKKMDGLF